MLAPSDARPDFDWTPEVKSSRASINISHDGSVSNLQEGMTSWCLNVDMFNRQAISWFNKTFYEISTMTSQRDVEQHWNHQKQQRQHGRYQATNNK